MAVESLGIKCGAVSQVLLNKCGAGASEGCAWNTRRFLPVCTLMVRSLILTLLLVGGALVWTFRGDLFPATEAEVVAPRPERYQTMVMDLSLMRQELASEFRSASSQSEKDAVLNQSRELLEIVLPEMMRCWLGTPWDYNGMAEQPGSGAIACGYYVATVLCDAGFDVPRIRLAQSPSELILKTFVPKTGHLKRIGVPIDQFLGELEQSESGIYIVGLDTHVGFLVHQPDGDLRFIHASGARPWAVVDEEAQQASVLRASRYKVTGNVTGEDKVIEKWLEGAGFTVAQG